MARNIIVCGNPMPQIPQAAIHSHGNFHYLIIITFSFLKNQAVKNDYILHRHLFMLQ